jgi:hypothetical protein
VDYPQKRSGRRGRLPEVRDEPDDSDCHKRGIERMEMPEQLQSLSAEEVYGILSRTEQEAARRRFEPYNTTNGLDPTARHLE